MSNVVYVGNLVYSITEQDLEAVFSPIGPISKISIITDRETGRAKGFAFVEFENSSDAQNALRLDGEACEGRAMKVSLARPKKQGGGGGGGRSSGGGRW